MTRFSLLLIAAAAAMTVSSAEAQYYRGYGWEPPCEPGKHRVIIRGNSQCRYPGEARGYRGYEAYGSYRDYGYRGRVMGRGPSAGCPPGRVRVWDGSNGQCR